MARRGRPPYPDVLTPGEWRVLNEIRTGATNAEIAVRLGLSLATIKFHVRNIRAKLELDEREQLIAWQPEEAPARTGARRVLAPLGLLLGFWKPAIGVAAVTVVGGAAIAAGVFAYTIANEGEAAPPGSPQELATATATPTDTPSATATEEEATEEAADWNTPSVTFWGEVPEEQQAELRQRVADVVRFYDERFGVRVPDLSIHIAADDEAWAAALGGPVEPVAEIHKATYRNGAIFIHATRTFDWIERFYFEAFQEQAAEGRDLGPEWLGEGAAMYAAHLFRHWRGEKLLADASALWRWAASYDDTPLQALEAWSPTAAELTGVETAATATLAAEWLVSRAGEAALVAYYEALPTSESWQESFGHTFGLSPGDAYEGIEAHRAAVLVVRRTVTGGIRGPDDEPVDATRLFVYAVRVDGSGSEGVTVAMDGRFTVRPPDSTYRLKVTKFCPPDSSVDLGWYEEESGFTTDGSEATRIVVDGSDVSGIAIRLPGTVEELAEGCEA